MGSSIPALTVETLVPRAFLMLSVAGFKKNLWLVVAGSQDMVFSTFFITWSFRIPVSPSGGRASACRSTFSPADS
jgi:hypothetical protein